MKNFEHKKIQKTQSSLKAPINLKAPKISEKNFKALLFIFPMIFHQNSTPSSFENSQLFISFRSPSGQT